jgi:hypothetical protein
MPKLTNRVVEVEMTPRERGLLVSHINNEPANVIAVYVQSLMLASYNLGCDETLREISDEV